jgi:predicted transcriptional regulator
MLKIYKLYAYTLVWLYEMPKRRTTIVVDDQVWKRLLSYVVKKHGTAKKASFEVEKAVKEYLDRQEKQLK